MRAQALLHRASNAARSAALGSPAAGGAKSSSLSAADIGPPPLFIASAGPGECLKAGKCLARAARPATRGRRARAGTLERFFGEPGGRGNCRQLRVLICLTEPFQIQPLHMDETMPKHVHRALEAVPG